MSNNLIWIFSILSIVGSILLLVSSIRLFKMSREINRLELENHRLKIQLEEEHIIKKLLIELQEEYGNEEAKVFIKWAANLSREESDDDENTSMNWILWPPKADKIIQDLIEYQKISENKVPYGEDWKKEVLKFTREELAELLRAACLRRDELQKDIPIPRTITREVNCEPLREEIAHMSSVIEELKLENATLKENGSELHDD